MNPSRLAAATWAQLKMYLRRRVAVFWSLIFPMILLGLLGIIFGRSVSAGSVDLIDRAHTPASAAMVRVLSHDKGIDVHAVSGVAAARTAVRNGDRDGLVVLTRSGRGVHAMLYYSNASAEQAGVLRGVVSGAASGISVAATGAPPAVTFASASVDSSALSYTDFLLPGVLAISIMISAVIGLATTLVNWRQRGVLRRLKLTPMPLPEFLLSRILASLVISMVQVGVLIVFGVLVFGTHIAASAWVAVPVALAGALCFLTMGLAVGSLAASGESADAITNVITNPMMFLSGTFFPVAAMPGALQQVAKVLPLYYMANGLRDTIVRGRGMAAVAPDIGVLLGVALVLIVISMKTFRWEPSN